MKYLSWPFDFTEATIRRLLSPTPRRPEIGSNFRPLSAPGSGFLVWECRWRPDHRFDESMFWAISYRRTHTLLVFFTPVTFYSKATYFSTTPNQKQTLLKKSSVSPRMLIALRDAKNLTVCKITQKYFMFNCGKGLPPFIMMSKCVVLPMPNTPPLCSEMPPSDRGQPGTRFRFHPKQYSRPTWTFFYLFYVLLSFETGHKIWNHCKLFCPIGHKLVTSR